MNLNRSDNPFLESSRNHFREFRKIQNFDKSEKLFLRTAEIRIYRTTPVVHYMPATINILNAFCFFLVPSAVTSMLAHMPVEWEQRSTDGICRSIGDGSQVLDDALPVEEEGTEEEEGNDGDTAVTGDGTSDGQASNRDVDGLDGMQAGDTDSLDLW